jgi:hypothetical protein
MSRTRSQLLRDYALYFAITFAFCGIAFWLAVEQNPDSNLAFRFAACALSGMVSFGLFIKTSKPLWRKRSFWVASVLLLMVHCIFFWFVPLPDRISAGLAVLFIALELGLFNTVRVICFRYHPPKGEEIV